MARVPTLDAPRNQLQGIPVSPIQPAISPNDASLGARQTQQFGDAIQKAAAEGAKILSEENSVRVDDAVNQLKEKQLKLTYDKDVGFQNQVGINALQRQSGRSLTDDYTEIYQKQSSDISQNLGNEQQKMAFAKKSKEMEMGFTAQTTKHEADQFKDYTLSVREGTIKNGIQEITLNYDNPAIIESSIASIRSAVTDQAKLLGKSATWAEARSREMTSEAHKVAIGAAIDKGNLEYADQYLKKYSKDGQIQGDDILKVGGLLTKEMDKKVGLNVATGVMQSVSPMIQTNSIDRAFNIALKTESGNRQFDNDGRLIKSSAGAIGAAQVMPATGPDAAKMAGVEWDENKFKNDPDYNRALGKAYFVQQLKDFKGDVSAAYAAYNAGPRAVQEAMKKALDAARPPLMGALDGVKSYLEYLPKETRDYVEKNVKAYNAGLGDFEKPTLMQVHQRIRQALGPEVSTERLKIAIDEGTRQYDDYNKALKQRDDDAVAGAMKELVANGGNYTALPPMIRSQLPPTEIAKVMDFGKRISQGDDVTNLALYQKLSTSPNYLKSLSDSEFYRLRGDLSESDFKHFSGERGKLNGVGSTEKPDDINSSSVNSVVDNRLRSLGRDPTPKDGDPEAIQVATVRKYINERILSEQVQSGKRMNDAEINKFVDKIFLETAQQSPRGLFSWFEANAGGRAMTMRFKDIPNEMRMNIQEDFKAKGIDPSESEVLQAYWNLNRKKR